jgi:hypothetical protein
VRHGDTGGQYRRAERRKCHKKSRGSQAHEFVFLGAPGRYLRAGFSGGSERLRP